MKLKMMHWIRCFWLSNHSEIGISVKRNYPEGNRAIQVEPPKSEESSHSSNKRSPWASPRSRHSWCSTCRKFRPISRPSLEGLADETEELGKCLFGLLLEGFRAEGGVVVVEAIVNWKVARSLSRSGFRCIHGKFEVGFIWERGGTRFFFTLA
jgi:thiol-disulfide isomerase/thioredoxin